MSKLAINASMVASPQRSSQSPDTAFIEQWQQRVSACSKCELTDSKDKLIAFAGLAQSILSTKTDHYVAGMWESSIVYDLAWWRSSIGPLGFPDQRDLFSCSQLVVGIG